MPASETPTNPLRTSHAPEESGSEPTQGGEQAPPQRTGYSTSRYVDYETHELLETISQLEDERRWQRIREGIWISIILHIFFFSALTWIPRYVFHTPEVIDPFDAIRKRKDLTYLDDLPNAIKEAQRAKLPPIKPQNAQVDKKTMDALKAMPRPQPKVETPPQQTAPPPPQPAPQQQVQQPSPPTPAPQSVAPPQPNPQVALDTPRPAPVPARPNFSLGSQNPADQLRQAMRDSARAGAQGSGGRAQSMPGLPEASTGGMEVLSDLQGVDFTKWFPRVVGETRNSWLPLIPEEVRPPIYKRGIVAVRFKVLPNGRVMPGSMVLDGRSGDVALDRAAWGAITSSNYPAVPADFHGPYVELRIYFLYNTGQDVK